MKGEVIHFSAQNGAGIITGSDEKRYSFNADDWRTESTPLVGDTVDFELNDKSATEIYCLKKVGLSAQAADVAGKIQAKLRDISVDDTKKKLANSNWLWENKYSICAAAILLGSFQTFVQVPAFMQHIILQVMPDAPMSTSLFGTVSFIGEIKSLIKMFPRDPRPGGTDKLLMMLSLWNLLYIIPLSAGWLL